MKKCVILMIVFFIGFFGELGNAQPKSDLQKMQILEQTPLIGVDGELFLLDGEVWIRMKGECKFRLAEAVWEDQKTKLAESTPKQYEVVLSTVDEDDLEFVSGLGCSLLPTGREGRYRADMTKKQLAEIFERGISFEKVSGNHGFKACMPTKNEIKRIESPNSLPPAWINLFSEGFEWYWPGMWEVGDTEGWDDCYWGDVYQCCRKSGDWSGWCSDDPDEEDCTTYCNDMDAYMRSPTLDVSSYNPVKLTYWVCYDTEEDEDWFRFQYTQGSIHFEDSTLDAFTGDNRPYGIDRTWYFHNFDRLRFQFHFDSDWLWSDYEGAYLDDIQCDGFSGINEPGLSGLPTEYELTQNFPNPFNPSTSIIFGLPHRTKVRLTIYNIIGQEIDLLVDGGMDTGYHQVTWDASAHSSGIYFYKLTTDEQTITKRMTLLK